jgi:hypothetical protein
MSLPDAPDRPLSEAERTYRRNVEALVESCLKRVRQYRLPDDAEPAALDWPPHD